jgi:hypothetical protein
MIILIMDLWTDFVVAGELEKFARILGANEKSAGTLSDFMRDVLNRMPI